MQRQPDEFEVQILRTLNGEEVPGLVAGAAMWEAARSLRGMGLAQGTYYITQAGKDYLAKLDGAAEVGRG